MKKVLTFFMIITALALIPAFASADTSQVFDEAEKLFNDRKGSIADFEKTIVMYKQILEKDPKNYEALWKCSRSYRNIGDQSKINKVEGWEDTCAVNGKEGMNYALKAIEVNPDHPAGHFFYGLNVGVYSDGVSILTALREGLKDKTQSSFEKTVELDKNFEEAGGILSLGRFWTVLPWPLNDKEKALKYFREYQKTPYFGVGPEGIVYLSELLIDLGGDKQKAEAKQHLTKFNAPNPYFQEIKDDLMKQL